MGDKAGVILDDLGEAVITRVSINQRRQLEGQSKTQM